MELFEKIMMGIMVTSCVVFTIVNIIDLVRFNKEYKKEKAELKLYEGALCREHKMLKAVQKYAEWLDTFGGLMATNNRIEPNDYNMGAEAVAKDCLDEFINIFNEFVGDDNGR